MFDLVLFEDHSARNFRPLSASTPTCDLRCGMFSLRERLNLLLPGGGHLRLRAELVGLADDPDWSAAADPAGERVLWLSGRFAPAAGHLAAVVAAARTGDFACRDAAGLVATAVSGSAARDLAASWSNWSAGDDATAWEAVLPASWAVVADGPGGEVLAPAADPSLNGLTAVPALQWIWELVPATADALAGDLAALGREAWSHAPWALVPAARPAAWTVPRRLQAGTAALPAGVHVTVPAALHRGPEVSLGPGSVIDTAPGPVVLDRGVTVEPHVLLQGPLYLGDGSRVKAGARLYGESSFGLGNRLAGEIGESTFGDFVNKQHDGFIGHAVLGSWVNLGAMTTCSDLKNNYGPVRVDLGDGPRDTGQRLVGLLAGDHVKTAIGTLFNTGTVVGFASNVFGGGMPPKHLRAFRWGADADAATYEVARALATAATVLERRGCRLTPAHAELFRHLAAAAD